VSIFPLKSEEKKVIDSPEQCAHFPKACDSGSIRNKKLNKCIKNILKNIHTKTKT